MKDVLKAIEDYGPKELVITNLFALMGEGVQVYYNHRRIPLKFNVLVLGKQGIGKSYCFLNLAQKLLEFGYFKEKDVQFIHGFYTTKALTTTLVAFPQATYYVDESYFLLRKRETAEILKQMLYGDGKIAWMTSREENNIQPIEFRGNVVFCANVDYGNNVYRRNADLLALADRCFCIVYKPSNKELVEQVEKGYEFEGDVWRKIAKEIAKAREGKVVYIRGKKAEGVRGFWKEKFLECYGEEYHPLASLRSFEKCLQIFARARLLFKYRYEELAKKLCERVVFH